MNVKFKQDFGSPSFGLLEGTVHEVVEKKPAGPYTKYIQYRIKIPGVKATLNVPEYYVTELNKSEEESK